MEVQGSRGPRRAAASGGEPVLDTNNKLSTGAAPSHTRPCVRHLISHAWGFRSFPVTAPLAWAACQLQHLPRYPSLDTKRAGLPSGITNPKSKNAFPSGSGAFEPLSAWRGLGCRETEF